MVGVLVANLVAGVLRPAGKAAIQNETTPQKEQSGKPRLHATANADPLTAELKRDMPQHVHDTSAEKTHDNTKQKTVCYKTCSNHTGKMAAHSTPTQHTYSQQVARTRLEFEMPGWTLC